METDERVVNQAVFMAQAQEAQAQEAQDAAVEVAVPIGAGRHNRHHLPRQFKPVEIRSGA